MDKIKVLIADSSEIFALGLFSLLSTDERVEAFNNTYTWPDILENAKKIKPDIILADFSLLNLENDERIFKTLNDSYKIIVLVSEWNAGQLINKFLDAGAKGIIPRDLSPEELVNTLIDMARFGATIHPTLMPQILNRLQEKQKHKAGQKVTLSERENEIIELVAQGKNNHAIGETLFISENTVKGHIKRICGKLDLENRVEIARYVLLNN